MKTYSVQRLCHQFKVRERYLERLKNLMHHYGFINMIGNDRYSELEKLQYPMSKENRDELFKLIDNVKKTHDKTWGDL